MLLLSLSSLFFLIILLLKIYIKVIKKKYFFYIVPIQCPSFKGFLKIKIDNNKLTNFLRLKIRFNVRAVDIELNL